MELDLAQVAELLREPRETLDVEIKSWLDLRDSEDRLKVAKAICALANHGGGNLILGFRKTLEGPFEESPNRPGTLQGLGVDAINQVVAGFIQPVIHCDVRMIRRPGTNSPYPVVFVPGGHTIPLRVIRQTAQDQAAIDYYIRRPGPASERALSPQEWDKLIRQCVFNAKEELLTQIRVILGGGPVERIAAQPQQEQELEDWFRGSGERGGGLER